MSRFSRFGHQTLLLSSIQEIKRPAKQNNRFQIGLNYLIVIQANFPCILDFCFCSSSSRLTDSSVHLYWFRNFQDRSLVSLITQFDVRDITFLFFSCKKYDEIPLSHSNCSSLICQSHTVVQRTAETGRKISKKTLALPERCQEKETYPQC